MPGKLLKTEEEEAAFVKDYEKLVSVKDLAKKWGCTRQTASTSLKRLGVKVQRPRGKDANGRNWKGDYHPMLGKWPDSLVAKDILLRTGKKVSRAAVCQARKRRGIKALSEAQHEAMKARIDGG
mgnify:CR=1 FL=1|tara:strand:+ start:86 stop:457 length:372 start_codon:yes stop_codon:yes gene_type:complete